jgi:predicted HicB family RNase H-like nuclease
MEKTINFKVNAEFYKQIKVKLAKEGKTLKQYIIELIKNDLEAGK